MKESKGSTVLSIILTVLVVGLVGYIIYDKVAEPKNPGSLNVGTKENVNKELTDNNEINGSYDYGKVVGVYDSKEKLDCTEVDEENVSPFGLTLYDNGLFLYSNRSCTTSDNIIGNYIIKDNKVNLNVIYILVGEGTIYHGNGVNSLTINADGTLSGSVIKSKVRWSSSEKADFVKTSKQTDDRSPFLYIEANSDLKVEDR